MNDRQACYPAGSRPATDQERRDFEEMSARLRGTNNKPNGAEGPPQISSKRSPLDWAELSLREPPPRQWYIEHWAGPGAILFAGRGGIGKSLLAQEIGTAAAMGINFLDQISRPLKVLMWAYEDDHDELWRRQINICRMFNIQMDQLRGRFIVEPRLGMENTLFAMAYGVPMVTPLFAELVSQINDYDADITGVDYPAGLRSNPIK
jgi:hypothetical protein